MTASCNSFRYLALSSATSFGRGRRIDQCFYETHKKKSQGVTSGDLEYRRDGVVNWRDGVVVRASASRSVD